MASIADREHVNSWWSLWEVVNKYHDVYDGDLIVDFFLDMEDRINEVMRAAGSKFIEEELPRYAEEAGYDS